MHMVKTSQGRNASLWWSLPRCHAAPSPYSTRTFYRSQTILYSFSDIWRRHVRTHVHTRTHAGAIDTNNCGARSGSPQLKPKLRKQHCSWVWWRVVWRRPGLLWGVPKRGHIHTVYLLFNDQYYSVWTCKYVFTIWKLILMFPLHEARSVCLINTHCTTTTLYNPLFSAKLLFPCTETQCYLPQHTMHHHHLLLCFLQRYRFH